jgi:hypothetical protein
MLIINVRQGFPKWPGMYGVKSLCENSVLEEGHGFSRAVDDTARPGFSKLRYVFLILKFLSCAVKRCPQGLKPSSMSSCCGTAEAVPFHKDCVLTQILKPATPAADPSTPLLRSPGREDKRLWAREI